MKLEDSEKPFYELKIESGVGGGSISLDKNKARIDGWVGQSLANKNDYLIGNLARLLDKNSIRISAVSKIIYSDNPGSQTGLRIMLSIIKGLSAAHNIEFVGKNLFRSIADYYALDHKEIGTIIVLPVKPNAFVFVNYSGKRKIEEQHTASFEKLSQWLEISGKEIDEILIPLRTSISVETEIDCISKKFTSLKITNLGENLSAYL